MTEPAWKKFLTLKQTDLAGSRPSPPSATANGGTTAHVGGKKGKTGKSLTKGLDGGNGGVGDVTGSKVRYTPISSISSTHGGTAQVGTTGGLKRKRSHATATGSKKASASSASEDGGKVDAEADAAAGERKHKANRQKKKTQRKHKLSKLELAAARDAKEGALTYLRSWRRSHHPTTGTTDVAAVEGSAGDGDDEVEGEVGVWKFQKARQNYIIRHLYDPTCLTEVDFEQLALPYLDTLNEGGGPRTRLLETARDLVSRSTAAAPAIDGEGDTEVEKNGAGGEDDDDDTTNDGDFEISEVAVARAKKLLARLGDGIQSSSDDSSSDDDSDASSSDSNSDESSSDSDAG